MHVKRAVADAWLKVGTGHGLKEREDKINSTFAPDSCIIPNMTAMVETETKRGPGNVKLRNVAGTIPGSGDLANETIVLGAHYDHVGYGGFSSMAQVKVPTIHPGADDNGSGTTGLLELARRMAIARKESPDKPCRRFVFVAFSGEELGLYGSVHYCKEPLFPLDKTRAMLNIDMIGKLRPDKMNGKDRLLIKGPVRQKNLTICWISGMQTRHFHTRNKNLDLVHQITTRFAPKDSCFILLDRCSRRLPQSIGYSRPDRLQGHA